MFVNFSNKHWDADIDRSKNRV